MKEAVQHKHVSNASIEDDIICDKDAKDRLKIIFKCVDASTILHNLYSSLRQNILFFSPKLQDLRRSAFDCVKRSKYNNTIERKSVTNIEMSRETCLLRTYQLCLQ